MYCRFVGSNLRTRNSHRLISPVCLTMTLFILGLFAVAPVVFTYRAKDELSLHSISEYNSSLSLQGEKCRCSYMTWEDQEKKPCCAKGLVCEFQECKPQLMQACSSSAQCAGSIYQRETSCEKDDVGKYRCCIKDLGRYERLSDAKRHTPLPFSGFRGSMFFGVPPSKECCGELKLKTLTTAHLERADLQVCSDKWPYR